MRQTYLYRLLRPEFVKTYHRPLSSDAFSNFGGADNVGEGHDKEVQEATDTLLNAKIPAFAAWLDQQAFKNGTKLHSCSVFTLTHTPLTPHLSMQTLHTQRDQ